jgi:hypothetical protein
MQGTLAGVGITGNMSDKELKEQKGTRTGLRAEKVRGKRHYQKPAFSRFGSTVELTNGPSLGLQESGNPGIFKA